MRILRNTLICVLCTVLLTLPFFAPIVMAFSLPEQYDNSFMGALDEKYEALTKTEGKKMVVIGGSSVAFGVDTRLIQKYVNMPVINFGLYAALGTKLMLDLSYKHINEGDIVVIAPELDAQTLSLYFNSESTLQAMESDPKMLTEIREENLFNLLGATWNLGTSKLQYIINNNKPNPDGVYNSKNFNEYGDLIFERSENIMPLYYEPTQLVNPTASIVSDDFIEYLNEYINHCKREGAEVYFSFCPMNEKGLDPSVTEESLDEFSNYLQKELDCEIISDINDYVYEAGYFYDTNFHLNSAGATTHTLNLIYDLILETENVVFVEEDAPAAPELPAVDFRWFEDDENAKYFTFNRAENGAYYVSGLSELGKTMQTLTLPLGYDTYKVLGTEEGFLEGGVCTKLILPENTNIRYFADGSFKGAGTLREMWIYYPNESDILPPANFAGVASDFVVHIPYDSNYDVGYYWGERGLMFKKDIGK